MSPRARKQESHLTLQEVPTQEAIHPFPAYEGSAQDNRWEIGTAALGQPSPIRVLLMCNHPIEREGLRLIMAQHPRVALVGCTNLSLRELEAFDKEVDIILLDIHSDSLDVLELLPRVVLMAGRARVIVIVDPGKQDLRYRFAHLGAMGALSRDQDVESLLKAISSVHSGEIWFDRKTIASLIRLIAAPVRKPCDDDTARRIPTLTRREREIIQFLGQGLDVEMLAERLFISETTVRHHLSSIFEKLGVRDRFDLVFYAYRHGLAVPPRCTDNDTQAF